jgi:hypothetical protein
MLSERDKRSLEYIAKNPHESQPEVVNAVLQHEVQKKRYLEIKGLSESEVRSKILPDDPTTTFGELYDLLIEDGVVDPDEVSFTEFYITYT